MADNALIDEILGIILANPDHHNQCDWYSMWDMIAAPALKLRHALETCGTAACVAGWIGALTLPDDAVVNLFTDPPVVMFTPASGEPLPDYARDRLGITAEQAEALFCRSDNAGAILMLKHLKDYPSASMNELLEAGDCLYPD